MNQATVITGSVELSDSQFERISRLVGGLCGINLHAGKRELVKARLAKRLRKLGLQCFDDYLAYVQSDTTGKELTAMLNALSTNLTRFFREPDHFSFLASHVLARLAKRPERRLRIWSAGCATGEEPYSITITAREAIGDLALWDAAVLATDLSTDALATARAGIYDTARLEEVSPPLRSRYFEMIQTRPTRQYRVLDDLRNRVHFARLNLVGPWPMHGPFDVIFCRNVMIYFDKDTQARLIERFWEMLAPGGFLFVGHSESLAGIRNRFQYERPTVYRKD